MNDRTIIRLQVLNKEFVIQSSFVLNFISAQQLDYFVEDVLEEAQTLHATLQCEVNTYGVSINGVKVERTKK